MLSSFLADTLDDGQRIAVRRGLNANEDGVLRVRAYGCERLRYVCALGDSHFHGRWRWPVGSKIALHSGVLKADEKI